MGREVATIGGLGHRIANDWWQKRGVWAWALRDVAFVYGWLSARRIAQYASGRRTGTHLPVPVWVVGNVVAGGAGKTPTTVAVVAHMQARGLRVGVVSSGHGRRKTAPDAVQQVAPNSNPHDVGDEPLLIHQHTQAPVYVAQNRVLAALQLLADHPGTQLIVSDDGLQHLQLARDLDIVVFDERGLGNGWCLPAGPLREPWPRQALAAQTTKRGPSLPPTPQLLLNTGQATPALPGFNATRRLADHAINRLGQTRLLSDLAKEGNCAALAAIAKPEAFFGMLRTCGLPVTHTFALPDHYKFDSKQMPWLLDKVPKILFFTEKDAAKAWPYSPDAWAVPLVVDIEPGFYAALDAQWGLKPGPGEARQYTLP